MLPIQSNGEGTSQPKSPEYHQVGNLVKDLCKAVVIPKKGLVKASGSCKGSLAKAANWYERMIKNSKAQFEHWKAGFLNGWPIRAV